MPSSVALMESLHSKIQCTRLCPQPTVPPSPKPASPKQHCPMPSICPSPLPGPATGLHPCPSLHAVSHQCHDAMVVDRARAPGVVRTCFQCGQTGHMVRECPLPDTRPQIPRPQVHPVESQGRSLEDCENEIALLRDRLELYEKERKAPVEEQDFGDEAQ